MPAKPKVFVTRIIPEVGTRDDPRPPAMLKFGKIPLPPPAEVLIAKLCGHRRASFSLLTDKLSAAVLESAAASESHQQLRGRLQQPSTSRPCTERGIAVGNTPGVLTDATADMAFLPLDRRHPPRGRGASVFAVGPVEEPGRPLGHLGQDLAGRTLGIVGMGRIGAGNWAKRLVAAAGT